MRGVGESERVCARPCVSCMSVDKRVWPSKECGEEQSRRCQLRTSESTSSTPRCADARASGERTRTLLSPSHSSAPSSRASCPLRRSPRSHSLRLLTPSLGPDALPCCSERAGSCDRDGLCSTRRAPDELPISGAGARLHRSRCVRVLECGATLVSSMSAISLEPLLDSTRPARCRYAGPSPAHLLVPPVSTLAPILAERGHDCSACSDREETRTSSGCSRAA